MNKSGYQVTLISVENMKIDSDEILVDYSNLNVIKREHYLNGTYVLKEDFDNEYEISLHLYHSPNMDGQYTALVLGFRNVKYCDMLRDFYGKFLQSSVKPGEKSNMPKIEGDEEVCPLTAGEYWLNEVSFDTNNWPSHLPKGLLKAELISNKKDKLIGGARFIVEIDDLD